MNLMLFGLFSKNVIAIAGCYYMMISHSLVSAALFLSIGILYDRYHTRNLYYLAGLSEFMPLFSFFYFIFTLSNMAAPLTPNFIGEFLIFTGIGLNSYSQVCLLGVAIVLSAIYSI
jgi:NADH:ubiquinone oxidoreductase subunit 4 (subunit M)